MFCARIKGVYVHSVRSVRLLVLALKYVLCVLLVGSGNPT